MAFSYVEVVPAAELPHFVERVRALHGPDFKVFPPEPTDPYLILSYSSSFIGERRGAVGLQRRLPRPAAGRPGTCARYPFAHQFTAREAVPRGRRAEGARDRGLCAGLQPAGKGLQAGMDDYISKPFQMHQLENVLERLGSSP